MKKRLSKIYYMIISIKSAWISNYRFHGGWTAALRCMWGTLKSYTFPVQSDSLRGELDILTFSIAPSLTLVWLAFIRKVRLQCHTQIFIGDCSGGIWPKNKELLEDATILPFQNETHGYKLDHFFARICQAEYVLVCDDDVFFLDAVPLEWGLSQMRADPNLAVVSFLPRQRFTWQINQQEYMPMGSYCLLVRRNIWLKEKLSFKTVHQPSINPKSYRGEYDTADFANVELIRRGYRVLIAPPDLRSHLHINHGISGTLMETQNYSGRKFSSRIRFARPLDTTYTNLSFLKNIGTLPENIYPGVAQNSSEWQCLIQQSLQILAGRLSPDIITHLDGQVDHDIQNLSSVLFDKTNF